MFSVGDLVEILEDAPRYSGPVGMHGVIVELYDDEEFVIEVDPDFYAKHGYGWTSSKYGTGRYWACIGPYWQHRGPPETVRQMSGRVLREVQRV